MLTLRKRGSARVAVSTVCELELLKCGRVVRASVGIWWARCVWQKVRKVIKFLGVGATGR